MMSQTDIVTVDLASRRKRVLTAATNTSDAQPRYSPDGRAIAFHAYDTKRTFNDQGHLVLLARGAAARCGGSRPKLDRATSHVAWTPDSRALLFTLESHGRVGIARLPLDAADAVADRAGRHGRRLRAIARRRACSRSTARSAHAPPALFACRADGSGERSIETVNRALLARHAIGEVREVTVKGWGGEPVQMFITYPPNFDPQKKWPLLHSIHGGPHAAHRRRLAFPLEHAGVRGLRLRRRRGQLPRLVRLRPEMARDDHGPATARRSTRTSRRAPTGCCARATSTARGSSRPAAATAATWSPT